MFTNGLQAVIAMILGSVVIVGTILIDSGEIQEFIEYIVVFDAEKQKFDRKYTTSINCPTCLGVSIVRNVVIETPQEIRIDQSAVIRFRYSDRDSDGTPPTRKYVSFTFDVTLSGANFDVKPQEKQSVNLQRKPGEAKLAWTIKPKTTGDHVAILDFSGLVENKRIRMQMQEISTYVTTDLQTVAASGDAIVELPITVLSEWNISSRVVIAVKAAIAFLGFIFVTPGVWWLARKVLPQLHRSPIQQFRDLIPSRTERPKTPRKKGKRS